MVNNVGPRDVSGVERLWVGRGAGSEDEGEGSVPDGCGESPEAGENDPPGSAWYLLVKCSTYRSY
jgi:hypothetical protein